ncbi:MAG TPA: STAS domain-containing protein [Anaerolineales bacterium]|nr:STAS domain-containing protein [Anaerolineales bacterium]
MNSDFKITSEQLQASVPVTVLHIGGWLDAQSEGQLLETAQQVYDDGARYLLVEMSDLDTLTSAGMRALQKVYQLYTPKDENPRVAHLKLCNAPPQIYNVLGITGFLQNISMYESLDSALASFGKE